MSGIPRRLWLFAHFMGKYGLTVDEVQQRIDQQGGGCAICGDVLVFGGKAGAHVDHNHRTGNVRGILCARCNTGIGKLRDSVDLLMSAVAYLLSEDGDEIVLG